MNDTLESNLKSQFKELEQKIEDEKDKQIRKLKQELTRRHEIIEAFINRWGVHFDNDNEVYHCLTCLKWHPTALDFKHGEGCEIASAEALIREKK